MMAAGRVVRTDTPLTVVTPLLLDAMASTSYTYDSGDRLKNALIACGNNQLHI